MENKSTVEPIKATKRGIPYVVEMPIQRKRTLEIGRTLYRTRKGHPAEPAQAWSIVRDLITAPPASDSSVYVAVLCEGIGELAGQWFVWRTYFTST